MDYGNPNMYPNFPAAVSPVANAPIATAPIANAPAYVSPVMEGKGHPCKPYPYVSDVMMILVLYILLVIILRGIC